MKIMRVRIRLVVTNYVSLSLHVAHPVATGNAFVYWFARSSGRNYA